MIKPDPFLFSDWALLKLSAKRFSQVAPAKGNDVKLTMKAQYIKTRVEGIYERFF